MMDVMDRLKEREHRLFRIEDVDSNRVSRSGALAETDFDNENIRRPTFRRAKQFLRRKYGEFSDLVVDRMINYLEGHEFEVEAEFGRPPQGYEHSLREQAYLEGLEKKNKWAYIAGLALHNIRYKNGDKTRFTNRIWGYLGDKLEDYAYEVRKIEPVIVEALRPAHA